MATFRRFGIYSPDANGAKTEILLNLDHIVSIVKIGDRTIILTISEDVLISTIDYEHLAAALDEYHVSIRS